MRLRSSSRKAGLNLISVGEILWVRSTHESDNSKAEGVRELALTTTEFGRARVDGWEWPLPNHAGDLVDYVPGRVDPDFIAFCSRLSQCADCPRALRRISGLTGTMLGTEKLSPSAFFALMRQTRTSFL
jgi:hypothetical protein